ncbi:hypothetical protein FRC03_002925 [Tulasnella sp. 419]|nr:hypothetical protein FRC03_002925 [Tulasnella sp. 419]
MSTEKASSQPTGEADMSISQTQTFYEEPFATFNPAILDVELSKDEKLDGDNLQDTIDQMIEIMLELAVWSESRPQMETAQHAKLIEEKLTEIAAREREQGRSFGFFGTPFPRVID